MGRTGNQPQVTASTAPLPVGDLAHILRRAHELARALELGERPGQRGRLLVALADVVRLAGPHLDDRTTADALRVMLAGERARVKRLKLTLARIERGGRTAAPSHVAKVLPRVPGGEGAQTREISLASNPAKSGTRGGGQ